MRIMGVLKEWKVFFPWCCLLVLPALLSVQARAADDDSYWRWAASYFGQANASDPGKETTLWGGTADPDKDGIPNLIEYATATNPNQPNQLSDCYVLDIVAGPSDSRQLEMRAWVRTDDPDLRVFCQTSLNLSFWLPEPPVDFDQPLPPNPLIQSSQTGLTMPGLRQMSFKETWSAGPRTSAFIRLRAARRGVSAASPDIEPFSFTEQTEARTGSVIRSNAVVLHGFTGTMIMNVPEGAVLYVNGVAQPGSEVLVKSGDTIWLQAVAPATAGVQTQYTLTAGAYSATWSFTTATPSSVPDHAGVNSGYTPVEPGVSQTGAAQISIPIVVSPGTAGMQPKLAIGYSSQAGNGPMGLGFSLSGLSAISRAGATLAQDGFKGRVGFDANDRFSLDGQRLMVINGSDGGDGAEYRLEFDPSSRIRSYGTEGSGPQRWLVETKSGLTLEFGGQANSRVKPEGGTATLVWALEKITDSAGNAMEMSYDETARQRGELLLTRIAYTSNPAQGLSPHQEVVCEYEDRLDTRSSYVGGFGMKMLKRLTAVESRATENGSMQRVRRYDFAYIQDGINKDSKLVSVQETPGNGTALPPTTFDWPASPASADSQFLTTATDPDFTIYDRLTPNFIGDYNGDGLTDYLDYNAPISDGKSYNLILATATGFAPAELTNLAPSPITSAIPGDYNGDGRMDILILQHPNNHAGKYQIRFSTDAGFAAPVETNILPVEVSFRPTVPGDYNGDGRTDLLIWNSTRSFYDIRFSNGTNFDEPVETAVFVDGNSSYNLDHLYPGDFNGDGRTDLLVFNLTRGKYDLCYAISGGFSEPVPTEIVNYSNIYGPGISGDFNGDGLTDFMGYDNFSGVGHYLLYLCSGSGFQAPITTAITGGQDSLGVKYRQSVDFNGDGKMDMATWHTPLSNHRLNIWISNGTGFEPAVATAIARADDVLSEVGDFNGDGRTDMLVYHWPLAYKMNLFLNQGPAPSLVRKVTNGHGGYTSFSYKPLTDPGVYTKGAGLTYPYIELQTSMYVVSSVTSRNGIDGDAFTGAGAAVPGEATVSYRYEGAWTDLGGRGFQGFKAVVSSDTVAGILTRTEYERSSPLLGGRPKSAEQRLLNPPSGGSALISNSESTWNIAETTHPTGRKTYFISEGSSTARSYEVNQPDGTALVKATITSGPASNGGRVKYDTFGNLLESISTTTGGGLTFSEQIVNTYADAPTPTKWHLGRLASSTVTKKGPDTPDMARTSSFAYHGATGLLTQEVIEPGGGALRQQKDYVHDAFGNIATSTISTAGTASRTTTTAYTPDGRFVASTTNAKGHSETKTYDPLLGNVLTQTGPNGLITGWIYDALGRPNREIRPDGTETRSFYRRVTGGTSGAPPRAVHYVLVQSSGGAPKTVWYDLLDREIRGDSIAFDGNTVSTHRVYNNRGEVTHAAQPYFAGDTPLYSVMTYDAVGREIQQTDPGNRTTTTLYEGLKTSVTNPKGQTTSVTANAMGWSILSKDASGKSISRSYDAYGNLRFVTDPIGNSTELRYDQRGNKIWMSEPNSGVSTFSYNGFGDLISQTNSAGETVSLTYDVLGRVVNRQEPEGTTIFEFDTAAKGIGQLARESCGSFDRLYFYDNLSRPAATMESHGFHSFAVSRGYDKNGRPNLTTFPTGFAVRQKYTALGHLSQVENAAGDSQTFWTALEVNARGQVTEERAGNGVVTHRSFDAETGLISSVTAGAGGAVQKLAFDFDSLGNLTQRRDDRFGTPFTETFGYDSLNRLTGVTTTGTASVGVGYNDLGNITSRSDVGSFSYGGSGAGPHALTGVSGGSFDKACTYDSKGNRVTDGATTLEYSSYNKPLNILKGGDHLNFNYGSDRSLFRQTIFHRTEGSSEAQSVREYVAGLYERETTSTGLVRHIHYIAGGNGVAAIYTQERQAATTAERLRYIHKDHLGSVDAITDANGVVVERQSFDAWGRRRKVTHEGGSWQVSYSGATASSETHRGFTGHEMLDAVQLVHMGGRIYDPLTARFLSPDPFVQSPDNLQNLNRYSYVLNNPLSFTDPSGFFFKKLFKTVAKMFVQHVAGSVFATVGFIVAGPAGAAFGYGFGSALTGTLLAGGSIGDGLRAGIINGISARVTYGVGNVFGSKGSLAQYSDLKPLVHGVTQGATRVAQGGKFSHGFLSATFASQFSGLADQAQDFGGIGAGRAVAAIVGGTAEVIGGGKFGNGAATGAFIRMLNDESHNEGPTLSEGTGGKAFVGGFFDYWGGNAMLTEYQNYKGPKAYFTWDQGSALASWIDSNGGNVDIVAHSYGADTAASVVADGHRVNNLLTLDPVSWSRPNFASIATNSVWTNINATGGSSLNFSNIVAGVGGAWNNTPKSFLPQGRHVQQDAIHADVHRMIGR